MNFKLKTSLTELLKVDLPIIQGGMVWCSGWELASAVSNCGGLGVIGSGSMYPDVLEHHILETKKQTALPFAVNLPLIYPSIGDHVNTIIKNQVPIVITSAGNPNVYTKKLKEEGIKVLHVVANEKFAIKALEADVDGLIAEGTEAGGHNGKDELTTLCLLPLIRKLTTKPLVIAGGIGSGSTMFGLMSMGADGVQVGTRFAISKESSAHKNFKSAVINKSFSGTSLTLKELAPVRMLKNQLFDQINSAILNGASKEELISLLGKGRSKKGIFEGDLVHGELEIGQVENQINEILSVDEIFKEFEFSYKSSADRMKQLNKF